MRTSQTDPIRVDFLPAQASRLGGRIGLTFAPGKKDPGKWNRDPQADVKRLRETYDASVLVCLLEDSELSLLEIEDLSATVAHAGMRFRRLPIRDINVPRDTNEVVPLVRTILAAAEAGDTVILHCRGGLGRAGLLGACCLVGQGHSPGDAIDLVRGARPGAIETRGQAAFVQDFARAWRGASPPVPSASRFLGCLLGGALGDALGYPVEFHKAASAIDRALGPFDLERLPHAKGQKPVVSDDTQMTLFTAEGLIRARSRSIDRGQCSLESVVLGAYLRWLETQTGAGAKRWTAPVTRGWLLDVPELRSQRAPGNTCLSALATALDAESLPTVNTPPNDSKGCGAVMRSAPFGLAAATSAEAFDTARNAAVLTHGHPSGYLSAAYFAAVVHLLARDVPLLEAMHEADTLLQAERGADELIAIVALVRAMASKGAPSRDVIERVGGGWVGEEALGIALLCALSVEDGSPKSIGRALWRAVAHAGDSDSTGSLTGNLLGAMFGVEALPPAWVAEVELRETIERIALDLHCTFVLELEPEFVRYPPN